MTPQKMVSRMRNKEGGFTLVELMVVVMIIAILMAIAIPTFLNSRKRAQDSAARSNVRNGLSAAQSVYSETQSYTDVTAAKLQSEEPGLTFVETAVASTTPKTISVSVGSDVIYLAAKSASGKCFALRHSVGTTPGTSQAELGTAATCSGTSAAAATTYTAL